MRNIFNDNYDNINIIITSVLKGFICSIPGCGNFINELHNGYLNLQQNKLNKFLLTKSSKLNETCLRNYLIKADKIKDDSGKGCYEFYINLTTNVHSEGFLSIRNIYFADFKRRSVSSIVMFILFSKLENKFNFDCIKLLSNGNSVYDINVKYWEKQRKCIIIKGEQVLNDVNLLECGLFNCNFGSRVDYMFDFYNLVNSDNNEIAFLKNNIVLFKFKLKMSDVSKLKNIVLIQEMLHPI